MVDLKGRHFLTLKDYTKEEILYLLDLAAELKDKKRNGIFDKKLANKNIALIFEKLSTRTRCAFAVACADEGASSEFLGKNDIHMGTKESVEDTARVLGRMYDAIEYRGFSHETVEKLAKYSGVPVWNGLTDDDHPTQVLADFLTIREHLNKLEGIRFVYIGDGRNNVANALMIGASKMGMDLVIVTPQPLFPKVQLVNECAGWVRQSGGTITITHKVNDAAYADVIYTDVWVSMGENDNDGEREKLLAPYQVNADLMVKAKETAIFMHCLPAIKGKEVTEEVFEGEQSVVFDEAENRMHTIKAVMVATLAGK